ncbi:MAG: hypothetical protein WBD27_02025 [Pyrinomonadaceae bacterium]
MSWGWLIFIVVIALGSFLMIGAQVIGLANTPGVLLCGQRAVERGKAMPFLGIATSVVFESIAALTLSALILSWVTYLTGGESKFVFAWIIGGVAAVYPMWQAFRLSGHERIAEPASYVAKGSTHSALPVALLITVVGTLALIFVTGLLDTVFYPLLIAAGFVAVVSVVSMIILYRALSSETGDG